MTTPFRVERSDWLSEEACERVHRTALRLLQEVGVGVARDDLRQRLARLGLPAHGEFVRLDPALVQAHVDDNRRRLAGLPQGEPADDGRLHLGVSGYTFCCHDPDTGATAPYTSEQLARMTRFADALADRGVRAAAPGFPADVPPDLQAVAQYRIGALYSRRGGELGGVRSPAALEHILAMAETMGQPIRSLPVYVISPLRLRGESLDLALHFSSRIDRVDVYSMPAAGATAPIAPFGGLCLALAEVLGSFVLLRELTDLTVDFSLSLYPFDLRAMAMVFGSPENFLFNTLTADLHRYYGYRRDRGSHELYVMAASPGPQAAAQKAGMMTAGALLGSRHFSGAGALSMDDIFSPQQLLLDCELRDHVQRLVQGLDIEDSGRDWVELIRQGVEHGFTALDDTLDNYRRLYWYPRLFDYSLGQWKQPGRDWQERTRTLFHETLEGQQYELSGDRRDEIDRIWQQAQREPA
jgi:trimethylamine:corrinoid methyltransferase-like protein